MIAFGRLSGHCGAIMAIEHRLRRISSDRSIFSGGVRQRMGTINYFIVHTGGGGIAISGPVPANARHNIGNYGAGVDHTGYRHGIKRP